MDGDEMSISTYDTPEERLRMYETLTPRISVIDTMSIKYNRNIGQNNNTAVLLYQGYNKDAVLIRK